MSSLRLAGFVLIAALSGACATSEGDMSAADAEGLVTYQRDIRPLVEQKCAGCHTEGGIGPFSFESWAKVKARAPLMAAAVADKRMPPWPVDEDCHSLRDVAMLDDGERALFASWEKDGFEEGDAADYHAPKKASAAVEIDVDHPDVTREPAEEYAVNPAISDEYRCFLAPQAFDTDTYVTAMDIRPGNKRVVHHVQVHTIPEASVAQAEKLDAAQAGPGWQCTGSTVMGSFNMFSWRPGSEVVRFDEGDAALLEAGTRIVLQVHYHPVAGDSGDKGDTDLSQVAFWTLPEGEIPEHIVRRTMVVASRLDIPAGEANYATEASSSIRSVASIGGYLGVGGTFIPGGQIIGMTPHMHMLGTRLSVTQKHADGSESCLIDVPRWDFEWQLDYMYPSDGLEAYDPGDSLTLRCEYDNSAENQPLVNGEPRDPHGVKWGEGTFDEMCLNYVWVRYARDSYMAAVGN